MWSAGFVALLVVVSANLVARRSPYFHGRAAGSGSGSSSSDGDGDGHGDGGGRVGDLADHPVKLVSTPWAKTQKDDIFTMAATHMALLHNALIRGFNSVYLQAEHIPRSQVDEFIGYALTWHKFIVSHHDDEEDKLFPDVVAILRDESVWGDMHSEHESFLPGLEAYAAHLRTHNSTTGLNAPQLLAIMDSFRSAFENHLHHEIDVMSAMAAHPYAPARDTLKGSLASDMLKRWGKQTVMRAGFADVVPFFLLNTDRAFEHGSWVRWPRMPEPVRWVLVNVVGAWHGERWRFASCDAAGLPRALYALRTKEEKQRSEL